MIVQQQDKSPLYNGRPPEKCGFDVRLFHPAFENFCRRYHGCEKLENENKPAVHDLLVCSADYYDNKSSRKDVFTPIINRLLQRRAEEQRNTDGTLADWSTAPSTAHRKTHEATTVLFFEVKNEIDAGDSDATLQAGLIYRDYWSDHMVLR